MTQLVSPPPDTISELLRTFSVRSTIFCISELRSPWAFHVSDEPVPKFHLVLEGSALLVLPADSVELAAGDVVILPRGTGHALASDRGAAAPPLGGLIREHGLNDGTRLRYGGSGPLTRLLCGGFTLAEGIPDSTLDLFPDALHLPFERLRAPWLSAVLSELKQEAEDGRPGAVAIVVKIADVFLAQALRAWFVDGNGYGLTDPGRVFEDSIAKAVQALNSRSSESWSVERLARHVGLSRTAVATKFRDAVGESPMRYLSEVRLRRASAELAGGRLTLQDVARRAGYATDAAFAKAFKRRFGLSPGQYRNTAGEPPQIELADVR
jgi:AraC-like DNA-binding protein